jgi:SPP1 gp7 family putative phage head morphogenesis protein
MALKKPNAFRTPPSAEREFMRALRKVGLVSGHIVDTHVDGHTLKNSAEMERVLKEYSKRLGPWAERQSAKMLEKVSKMNARAYKANSLKMGRILNETVVKAGTGEMAFGLMQEQVALIKSIPLDAANRAQKLAFEAATGGRRASDVAEDLARSTKVSESKALLIARTETARANAYLTQTRAAAAGAKGYIWRTTMDGAERDSHREMNGKLIKYDEPPTLIDGTTGHAGTFPNCRCFQDPVFDDTD